MSGKDLDQCMIDLLYGYTIASNTDTLVRKKIVSEINKSMFSYIMNVYKPTNNNNTSHINNANYLMCDSI